MQTFLFRRLVSIWFGGVDYHQRLMSGVRVLVVVQDDNNVTVKYWDAQLAWPGLNNVLFQLSDHAKRGTWSVSVTHASTNKTAMQTFRVLDQRNTAGGSNAPAEQPELDFEQQRAPFAAESHFVELEFSSRTPAQVRQGSSFAAEVVQIRFKIKKNF